MALVLEEILKEVEIFNESIRKTLDEKGINNTEEASKSLRIEFGNNFVKSIGVFYLEFLDTGRGPGKFPNIGAIREWVRTKKGVTDARELDRVTFLVARRIAQIGTRIFRNNSKGIELEKKINILNERLIETSSKAAKAEVLQRLDRYKIFRQNKIILQM